MDIYSAAFDAHLATLSIVERHRVLDEIDAEHTIALETQMDLMSGRY